MAAHRKTVPCHRLVEKSEGFVRPFATRLAYLFALVPAWCLGSLVESTARAVQGTSHRRVSAWCRP